MGKTICLFDQIIMVTNSKLLITLKNRLENITVGDIDNKIYFIFGIILYCYYTKQVCVAVAVLSLFYFESHEQIIYLLYLFYYKVNQKKYSRYLLFCGEVQTK